MDEQRQGSSETDFTHQVPQGKRSGESLHKISVDFSRLGHS